MSDDRSTSVQLVPKTAILSAFETFRDELDDHNDRRERLIKVSSVIVSHLLAVYSGMFARFGLVEQSRYYQPLQENNLLAA